MKRVKKKYGSWTVKEIIRNTGTGIKCICVCDCGIESFIAVTDLRAGRSVRCKECAKKFRFRCGKYDHEKWLGYKFGTLRVLKIGETARDGKNYLCKCDCGNEKEYSASKLKRGKILACLRCSNRKKSTKHGFHSIPEYKIWGSIKLRCRNPLNKQFKSYGARGIDICQPWFESFETFIKDVGFRPSKELTLDRIDNNKGYEPGNVRWVSMRVNSNNTRRSVTYEKNGVKYTARDVSELLNVPYSRVNWCLIRYGIDWVFDNVEKVKEIKKKTKLA